MATDFSFNGQTSYSPILAALAEAPMKNAQLKIQQEQNQRQRLSDLLTNMSSAAATARQIQLIHQQGIEQQSREDTAKDLGASGKLYLGNPAYAQSYGGFQGQLDSINKAFPSVPDNTAPSSNDGTGQNLNGIGNAPDIQNKLKLGVFGINPTQSSDANTGLTMSNYPGTGGKPTIVNPPPEGELPPVQNTAVMDHLEKMRSSPQFQDYVGEIQAARDLKLALNSKNPVARLKVIGKQLNDSGITRISPYSVGLAGHDPSAVESLKQKWQTAFNGNFTNVNTAELNQLSDIMLSSAQAGIKDLATSAANDIKDAYPKSVNPKIVDIRFNNAIAPHMKGPISVKAFNKNTPRPSSKNEGWSYIGKVNK